MWGSGMFLYYSWVCMVKEMIFESRGGGQEPRAGEDLLTHIPFNIFVPLSSTDNVWNAVVRVRCQNFTRFNIPQSHKSATNFVPALLNCTS